MTRRRQARRPRRNERGGGANLHGGISPVAFHALTTATLSGVTGTQTVTVSPNSAGLAGLNDIADQFDLYRLARLRYRLHPMDPTDTTNQGAAYYPDVDIQTQTVAQLAESPLAAVITPFCGVPSRWINVPRSQLKGMLDWYKCTADAGATEFETCGLIQIAGGLSDTARIEIEGIMHFKNPVSSALQLARAIDRAVKAGTVIRVPQQAPAPGIEETPTRVSRVTPGNRCHF